MTSKFLDFGKSKYEGKLITRKKKKKTEKKHDDHRAKNCNENVHRTSLVKLTLET